MSKQPFVITPKNCSRPLKVPGEYAVLASGEATVVHSSAPETVMTIHLSKQAKAMLSKGLPKMASGLVCRLVCARDDPGKERIRMWLLDLNDAQLKSGLGLTVEDIAVLRTGTKTASPSR